MFGWRPAARWIRGDPSEARDAIATASPIVPRLIRASGKLQDCEADQSRFPDMPCPQSTDTLSPLQPQYPLRLRPCPSHGCSHRFLQVRCDAASLGVPCTNCVAFQIECRIPTPRRKKVPSTAAQSKDSDRYIRRPGNPFDLGATSEAGGPPSSASRATAWSLGGLSYSARAPHLLTVILT
jgi:hypothetical protein